MLWVRFIPFSSISFIRVDLGASAGAGSGEFDIYRGCRRRQIIREAYLNRVAKEVGVLLIGVGRVLNGRFCF